MVPAAARQSAARIKTGMRTGPTQAGSPKPQPPPRLYAESATPNATGNGKAGRARPKGRIREPGDLPCAGATKPSGVTAEERHMTTKLASVLGVDADLQAIVAAILIGAFLVFGAGFASSAALHGAAHDSRHSITFPCH